MPRSGEPSDNVPGDVPFRPASDRVLVRRDPTRPSALVPVRELAEGTTVGEAYLASLLRGQWLIGARYLLVLLSIIGAIWVVPALVPAAGTVRVGPIPLAWLLMGFAFYPLCALLGWRFVRNVERFEERFVRLSEERPQ